MAKPKSKAAKRREWWETMGALEREYFSAIKRGDTGFAEWGRITTHIERGLRMARKGEI